METHPVTTAFEDWRDATLQCWVAVWSSATGTETLLGLVAEMQAKQVAYAAACLTLGMPRH